MALRVGVFFGGRSAEHEISIISAQQAIAVLRESYQVVPVYIAKEGAWLTGEALLGIEGFADIAALRGRCREVFPSLDPLRFELLGRRKGLLPGERLERVAEIDVALPILHGVHGEDGSLQGVFELANLPYAGSAVTASAVGMDKVVAKSLFRAAGLPVLEGHWFYAARWEREREAVVAEIEQGLGWPVVVKPADLGSSIGVGKARDREALNDAVELALEFSGKVLVEPAVEPLREINCAVVGDRDGLETSVCEEPLGADAVLSFRDKYQSGGGKAKGMASASRRVPAEIPAELEAEIRRMAGAAFQALDCAGAARIDFLLDAEGRVFVNEINTIPGSLSFYLWEAAGKPFAKLLDQLIELALKRHREKNRLQFSQETDVLRSFAAGGAKGSKGSKGA